MFYAILFIISFGICLIMVPILRKLSLKHNIMIDEPNERKVHNGKIPRSGGIAIAIGILIALVYGFITHKNDYNFVNFLGIIIGGTLSLAIGIYDDIKCISAKKKLLLEIFAATVLVAANIRIEAMNIPFWQTIYFSFPISIIVTILWVIIIMNAINLIDGVDGLAAGVVLIASIIIFSLVMMNGDGLAAVVTIALVGGCLAFLKFNRSPASIFMGDSGSMFLGFTLASVSIQASYKSTNTASVLIPVMILGVPLLDTVSAFVRRVIKHTSPFKADKDHIHHRLLNTGLTARGCVLVLHILCVILGAVALIASFMNNNDAAIMLIITGMIMIIGLILFYRYTGIFPTNGRFSVLFRKSCTTKNSDSNIIPQESTKGLVTNSPKVIH